MVGGLAMWGNLCISVLNFRQYKECCLLHVYTRAPFTEEHLALTLPISFLGVSDSPRAWKQRRPNWERVVSCQQSWLGMALWFPGRPSHCFLWEVFLSACWLAWKEGLPKWGIVDPQGVLSCVVGLLTWALLLFLPRGHFSWFERFLSSPSFIYVPFSAWIKSCSGYPGHS